ncbi:MAG: YbhB/YbcL family Raf kinase inhibitor-like protein [Novosphingobium sp.]|nr:YbhB/YbcL family Raf kinase inhibitor-like protein [Novosphingobium sp.]MBO9603954.1 YbhB/YbcL family Raf kinase inhibitor-like protein [Novosphingobium sp.]
MAKAGHASLAIAKLAEPGIINAGGFKLTSPAFDDGEELDPSFTADEEDAVAPPLEWTAPPEDAVELVLIVEDPDVSGSEPGCHWLVWGLAPQKGRLLEGEVPPRVGKNSQRNSEWLLPKLPEGEPHHYVFQLFALDAPIELSPGSDREALLEEMEDHVIAATILTAVYEHSDEDDGDWDDVDIERIDFDGN